MSSKTGPRVFLCNSSSQSDVVPAAFEKVGRTLLVVHVLFALKLTTPT